MTKINSNPPQNFHYIFLMHRFMIFKRSVQYANFFFVSVYMLLFPDFTTLLCCFSFPPPPPPQLWNAETVWVKVCQDATLQCLGIGGGVWLGRHLLLSVRWVAECTDGGEAELVDRIDESPLPYICFPALFKLLWSCEKTYFLYHFVWLNNHLCQFNR